LKKELNEMKGKTSERTYGKVREILRKHGIEKLK
jgi:GTP cyclohydrolase II